MDELRWLVALNCPAHPGQTPAPLASPLCGRRDLRSPNFLAVSTFRVEAVSIFSASFYSDLPDSPSVI